MDRDGHLPLDLDSSEPKLPAEGHLINGFQQARPNNSMYLNSRSDHCVGQS
jgi:hypothetical protein